MCPRIQTFVFLFLWLSCQIVTEAAEQTWRMSPAVIGLIFFLLPYQAESVIFEDTKPIIANNNEKVEFTCSHNDGALNVMLWYQQTRSGNMNLIGFGYYPSKPNYEKEFENRFEITRENIQNGGLVIKSVEASDSAVYFCAGSGQGDYPAYFGKGTKLTVLETGLEVTKPKSVKILPPSPKECRNEKDKFRKKTLVCVASGFYPDHVEVLWTINGNEAKDGVATDSAAKRVDKFYRITSRLRVLADDYNKPSNNFTCTVKFFDGEKTTLHHTSINGVEGKAAGGLKREDFLKMTNTAKLSYIVLMAKSCFYGLFVVFLVWKLQGSARKFH